jgi:hypothetical protein
MVGFWRSVWEVLEGPRLSRGRSEAGRQAQERGFQLLTRNLSPAQRQQFARYNYFDVIGGDTGVRYRIRHGHLLNVERLDEKGRRERLICFGPQGQLPVGDIMLAQKIALELFESEATRVANASPPWEYALGFEHPRLGRRFGRH